MIYNPTSILQDPAALEELRKIGELLATVTADRLAVLHVAPKKFKDGAVAIADGADWDPLGTGDKGPVWFDVDSGTWKALGGGGGGSVAWGDITGTPTTLVGYGITDGATDAELAAAIAAFSATLSDVAFDGDSDLRGASFSGGASPISTPVNEVPILIKDNCTITEVVLLTQGGNGDCVLDIWKSSYAGYPPNVGNTICAAAKPTISGGVKYKDTTLTGWTTALSAGDTLLVKLDSSTNFTFIGLWLRLVPT